MRWRHIFQLSGRGIHQLQFDVVGDGIHTGRLTGDDESCTDTAHNGCSHTTGTQESHSCFLFVSVDYLLQEIVYHACFQRNKCNEYIY